MRSGRFRESCCQLNFCWLVPYVWACSKPAVSCRWKWPEMPYDDVCAMRCQVVFMSPSLHLTPSCLSVTVCTSLSLCLCQSPDASVSLCLCLTLLPLCQFVNMSSLSPVTLGNCFAFRRLAITSLPIFFFQSCLQMHRCQIIHMDLSRSHNFPFITPTAITQKHKKIQLLIRAESVYTNPPYAPSRPFFASVFILLHQVHTPCLCSQPAKGGARWRRSITVTEA